MVSEFPLTKIIATLGPASRTQEIIVKLIDEGVRVFRINFSHGSFEEYEDYLEKIRIAEKKTGIFVAVLGDLAGPKIRIGKVIKGGITIREGEQLSIVKHSVTAGTKGYEKTISTNFPGFIDQVRTGEEILIDDGNIRLHCSSVEGIENDKKLVCSVVTGGKLSSAKGINLPQTELTASALTERDYQCIEFAAKNHFDYLALSFVRQAEDILLLKQKLEDLGARSEKSPERRGDLGFSKIPEGHEDFIPIIAKIEKPQAISNLEAIIRQTDAVMVARGDLGVEMDLADVAVLQKRIIHMCHHFGKPVIVATHMLQSMIDAKTPTRAEVSDVANAIFDGVDAVMLSGETAIGKYPLETVRIMQKVAERTSAYITSVLTYSNLSLKKPPIGDSPEAISLGVQTIAANINPKFLVIWTNRGVSAVFLSQRRMPHPILAFSSYKSRLRKLSLMYGVKPFYMKTPPSGSTFIRETEKLLLKNKWVAKGDPVVIISSDPIHRKQLANRIVIHHIGDKPA